MLLNILSAIMITFNLRRISRLRILSLRRIPVLMMRLISSGIRQQAALFERNDVIIVASVSCIYGLGSPEEYSQLVVSLRKG